MSSIHIFNRVRLYLPLIYTYIALVFISLIFQSITNQFFFINELNYLSSPYYDLKSLTKAGVYLVSYLISISMLFIIIIMKSTFVWRILLTFILMFYFIDISTQFIVRSSGFTKFEYIIFLNESKNYDNLLIFLSTILNAFLVTLLLGLSLIFIRAKVTLRLSTKWISLIIIPFLTVIVAKSGVYYIKYESYPAPIKIPTIISNYHLNYKEQPPRILDQDVIPTKLTQSKNIILIIDESISGNHLSFNGYNLKTTPDLEKYVKDGTITNFGVVNSVANCSATSNLMLRIGLSSHTKNAETDYVATRRSLPTIYQYAKRAGYKTWLIDSQADKGTLQNYLTYDDLQYIDEYLSHNTRTEDYLRDNIHLEKLKAILEKNKDEKKFIVFIKDGAHWPYLWRFPQNSILFTPIQSSEYEPMIKENKAKIINTYANLIKYTVNDFLKDYINKIDLKNTITFYTSDHGQAFMEEGAVDDLTHCSSQNHPPSSQAAVPLLIIEPEDELKKYIPMSNKLYSQYQIFPSILELMGYDDEIIHLYGDALNIGQHSDTKRWFYWGLEGQRSMY